MGGRKADLVPDLTLMVPGHHFQKGTLDRGATSPSPSWGDTQSGTRRHRVAGPGGSQGRAVGASPRVAWGLPLGPSSECPCQGLALALVKL